MRILNLPMNNKKLSTNEIERNNHEMRYLLPEGVMLYDYIESTGTLWIDTRIKGIMAYKYELDYQYTTASNYRMWGVFGQSSYIGYNMSITWSSGLAVRWESTSSGQNIINSIATIDTNRHKFIIDNGEIYYDSVDKGKSSGHSDSCIINYNIFLFTVNPGGTTPSLNAKAKVYSYKVYDTNNNLIQNFLPCTYNGVAGLWDTVSNSFFGNQGTGVFTLGTKIELKLFEYLASDSSKQCYIDTGINNSDNSCTALNCEYDVKFLSSTLNATFEFFAGYNSGSQIGRNAVNGWHGEGTTSACLNTLIKTHITENINLNTSYTTFTIKNSDGFVTTGRSIGGTATYFKNSNFYLFTARNSTNNYYPAANCAIYRCSMKFNEILVREFLPCSYNGEYGMWDRVNLEFYPNSGTGTFIVGTEIPQIEPVDPIKITCVEDTNCPGPYKWVYSFDSNVDKLNVTVPALGNNFTVSWWEYGSNFNDSTMPWGFSNGNRLNPRFYKCLNTGNSYDNPWQTLTGTIDKISDITNNVWHHFAITGDGSTNYLYIDGIKYGRSKTFVGLTGTSIYFNGWDSGTNYTRIMKMSDFKMFNEALSDADIYKLYTGGEGL